MEKKMGPLKGASFCSVISPSHYHKIRSCQQNSGMHFASSIVVSAKLSTMDVIINASSGVNNKREVVERLTDLFAGRSINARISLARSGREAIELARRSVRGRSGRIVAGGGDGTIAAIASTLVGTDKDLGVLPLGTFNYFARNLGIPLELEDAALNLIEGHPICVDVGMVNDRIFLNNSSLGLYPDILRSREREYRRWGRSKIVAYFTVLQSILRPSRSLGIRLSADGKDYVRRTPLIFIGSNKYQLAEFNLPGHSCVDNGELACYLTAHVRRSGLLRLALRTLFRRLRTDTDLHVLCASEFWIDNKRKRVRVAMDGELALMNTPLYYRSAPGALRVIVPQESETTLDSVARLTGARVGESEID
jgi:diacylglycerol kinase family enzyme